MAHRKGKVSGIGPVKSGRTYSRNLNRYNRSKNNNMKVTGVGPIADGAQYAKNIEAARKKSSAAAAAAAKAKAEAEAKAKAEAKAAEEKRVRMFDPNRLSDTFSSDFSLGNLSGQSFLSQGLNQPGRLGSWFDKGLNVRVPNEANASFGRLFKDDMSQLGKFTNKQGKVEGGLFNTGIPKNLNQVKQLFSGKGGLGFSFGSGIGTGPTPLGRQTVRRLLPYASQISLGKDIFNQGQVDSATSNLMNNINTSVANLTGGFINSPGNNPETDIGARAGRFFTSLPGKISDAFTGGDETQVASTDAGGLNIGGGVDSEEGFGNSNTGRVLNDIGNTINTYKGIFNDASAIKNAVAPKPKFSTFREDAAEQAALNKASTPLSIDSKDVRSDIKSLFASGMNYQDVANTVSDARAVAEGGAEGFKNLSETQQQNLVNSAGGIINNSKVFQSLGEQYTGSDTFKDQTQGTLAAVNKTMQEASQDTKGRVDPINNLLQNFNKIPGYETASRFLKQKENPNLTTRQQIQAAYDPTSPKAKALSAEDRGIVGSVGNLLIGGKLSDVFKANNPTERGTTFTPTDTANLVANSMIAANTPGSLTQQRFGEIGALTGQGTGVTAGSLIRGTLPRGGRTNNVSNLGGSGKQPALQTAPPAVQQEYPLPLITQQTGVGAGNLQNIQQNAYNNQMSMYATNPNYFAQFRPQQRFPRRGSFRSSFSRDYFN